MSLSTWRTRGSASRGEDARPALQSVHTGGRAFPRSQGGLGLGLCICPVAGQGSRWQRLDRQPGDWNGDNGKRPAPASRKWRLPGKSAAPESASVHRTLLIGLVDDHADSLSAMSELLSAWGHSVITANSVTRRFEGVGQPPGGPADFRPAPARRNGDRDSSGSWAGARSSGRWQPRGGDGDGKRTVAAALGFEKVLAKPVSMAELEKLSSLPAPAFTRRRSHAMSPLNGFGVSSTRSTASTASPSTSATAASSRARTSRAIRLFPRSTWSSAATS